MKKHIVVIEDDVDLLSAVALVLESAGYQVTGFPALTSFEALTELHADCFIFDEQLPYVSGHIICIMVKSNAIIKDVPVILISASGKLNDMALIGEADAFLRKPFDNDALVKIVEALLVKPA
jgi:DNA-binding response OmpR family regulator